MCIVLCFFLCLGDQSIEPNANLSARLSGADNSSMLSICLNNRLSLPLASAATAAVMSGKLKRSFIVPRDET